MVSGHHQAFCCPGRFCGVPLCNGLSSWPPLLLTEFFTMRHVTVRFLAPNGGNVGALLWCGSVVISDQVLSDFLPVTGDGQLHTDAMQYLCN